MTTQISEPSGQIATMDTSRSQELYQRAKNVIPKGVSGHYGYAVTNTSPVFFESSEGSRFTDVDGNTYIDWMCAYGPMILGYNHPAVEDAAARQLAAGNTVSLAAPVLVDLAEQLVDLVTGVDWALFGKNGADSTILAVMIARAATGRKYVVKVNGGYHGAAAWMQTPGNAGTTEDDHRLEQAATDTFYTGTQFFNAAPMAAALATIRELVAIDGATRITELGEQLNAGLIDVAASHGHDLRVTGIPGMPYYRIAGDGGFGFHAKWIAECVARGAYLLSYHNNFVSAAHTEDDIRQTWNIADQAFQALR